MHICALGNFFDLGNECRKFLPVELMVSQDVNYRPAGKSLESPFDPVPPGVSITGEHDHVSVHIVWLERRELQMKIAENVNSRDRI